LPSFFFFKETNKGTKRESLSSLPFVVSEKKHEREKKNTFSALARSSTSVSIYHSEKEREEKESRLSYCFSEVFFPRFPLRFIRLTESIHVKSIAGFFSNFVLFANAASDDDYLLLTFQYLLP
jgi:hypothetical protein